ncbi:hypothetical protein KDL01_33685 [Actinospica durhamensis]|uniref:Uncharacterized protein n=1 Tax=Actinospica durhamensis TaxID=1508375 RepID=A0A941IUY9_9ACTN|nr:hypothetical protein [Actinospica durhamensis]MBR7838273.1 hypothetical protein [Actinospica durhamensis]
MLAQLPHASIVGGCGCGCRTVAIDVDRASAAPSPVSGRPVAEAQFDGGYGGLMLFVDAGYITWLEIYTFRDEPAAEWPPPETLDVR